MSRADAWGGRVTCHDGSEGVRSTGEGVTRANQPHGRVQFNGELRGSIHHGGLAIAKRAKGERKRDKAQWAGLM